MGGSTTLADSAWQLLQLAIEKAWSALDGSLFDLHMLNDVFQLHVNIHICQLHLCSLHIDMCMCMFINPTGSSSTPQSPLFSSSLLTI